MNPSILSAALFRTLLVGAAIMLGRGLVPQPTDLLVVLAIGAVGALIDVWIWEAGKYAATPSPTPAPPVDTGQPVPDPVPAPPPTPAPVPHGSDFDRCLAVTLKWEGGNDDDPDDSGGRTSRGITAADWANWRNTHPGLPPDVWNAPQDQVVAIYKERYWNALWCDSLSPGVDLAVFDHGVLGGVGTSAKLLQRLVGVDADGEVGPATIAAAAAVDPVTLVNRFCDARLAYYQSLNKPKYIKGWTNRCNDVKKEALALAGTAPVPTAPATPAPSAAATVSGAAIIAIVTSLDGEHWTAGAPDPTITSWIEYIATKWPDRATYTRGFENHGYFAWCGLTVGYVMSKAGFKPPSQFFLAADWLNFGTEVDTPQPGDVLVYQWGDGSHHVSLYDHETPGSKYASHGGNQSHTVNVTDFPMASCIGVRRPS